MTLTRKEILAIARNNMMQYVHETFLLRFAEEIIAAEQVATEKTVQEQPTAEQ
jgi:hypothetical protein